jgi:hypothetical protein
VNVVPGEERRFVISGAKNAGFVSGLRAATETKKKTATCGSMAEAQSFGQSFGILTAGPKV